MTNLSLVVKIWPRLQTRLSRITNLVLIRNSCNFCFILISRGIENKNFALGGKTFTKIVSREISK